MTSSSSRRTTRTKPDEASETSVVPEIPYADLADVTADVVAMPTAPAKPAMPQIPELDAEPPASNSAGNRRQPYVNPLMPVLRRLRRQDPADIPELEMNALYAFLGDETGEMRVNSNFLSEATTFLAGELYERYSRTALTLAIYLGKSGGVGVVAAKREINRATGVVIGESDPLNGFPRHLGLRYTVQQLTDAITFLNEGYGDNGSIVPGAITTANDVLRQKNEAAGRTNRY